MAYICCSKKIKNNPPHCFNKKWLEGLGVCLKALKENLGEYNKINLTQLKNYGEESQTFKSVSKCLCITDCVPKTAFFLTSEI